jgi:hypothetical protein
MSIPADRGARSMMSMVAWMTRSRDAAFIELYSIFDRARR